MTLLDDSVPGVTGPAPTSYEQFWPYYVSQHLHPATRRIHVLGTLAGLASVAAAAVGRRPPIILAAPVLGYGPAWYGHFRIERNRPATFGHPLWSARADLRLLSRYLRGTLERDVSAVRGSLGIPEPLVTLADSRERSRARDHRAAVEGADRSSYRNRSHGGRPGTSASDRRDAPLDLCSFLGEGRSRVEQLADRYFATDSFAKRGGYVELLVKEHSNLTATRSEILRPLLREVSGGDPYLRRFDEARRRQVDLLAQLDELTVGVGPRDVHQHQAGHLVELVRALRAEIKAYDRYEAEELLPFLVNHLDNQRLEELGRAASKVSRRGPTHAHPKKPPADERNLLGKGISAIYDRLRNVAEHPERTIQTGGEQGP